MPRAIPARHVPRHHLRLRRPRPRSRAADRRDLKTSDLMVVLGVALLGGLCLLLAGSLVGQALAP